VSRVVRRPSAKAQMAGDTPKDIYVKRMKTISI
jgi:hypothetical protein